MLWDRPLFELAYCMVSTPEELIGWDDPAIHSVDHIDPTLRITNVMYERDMDKEELIKIKCTAAQKYVEQLIEQITAEHAGVTLG